MVKVKDKWFRIISISGIVIAAIYSNKLYQHLFDWRVSGRVLLTIASVMLAWEGNRYIILRFRDRFSEPYKLAKRLAFVFVAGMAFTFLVILFTAFAGYFLSYDTKFAIGLLTDGAVIFHILKSSVFRCALIFVLFLGIYEAMYYYTLLNQTEEEKKQLEKEKLWSRLENLNQQVNPHFLFNTLNSLSSLITEDPEEAERFLDEMSKVYRYLLQTNRHELVTLKTEIKFIHSFYHLLKIRYDEGIQLQINVPDEYQEYLLPPLTLQLLVENAVKHNITHPEQPLLIEILVSESNRLLVRNTLQKKTTKVLSHKVGLSNIADKYELMQQGTIITKEEGAFFTVSVPLIDPSVAKKMNLYDGPR